MAALAVHAVPWIVTIDAEGMLQPTHSLSDTRETVSQIYVRQSLRYTWGLRAYNAFPVNRSRKGRKIDLNVVLFWPINRKRIVVVLPNRVLHYCTYPTILVWAMVSAGMACVVPDAVPVASSILPAHSLKGL